MSMEVKHLNLADIHVPANRLRPVDDEAVAALVESIDKVGLRNPITVRPDPTTKGKYDLITGAHRLAAFAAKKYVSIPAFIRDVSDDRAELEEITENLHRKDLTELERSEQLARWIELTNSAPEEDFMGDGEPKVEAKGNRSAKATSVKGGRGKTGGINQAARVLPGVTRSGAQRAVKVAKLDPEAKKAAKEAGLADNQQALLKAAKAPKGKQAEVIKDIAAKKGAAKEEAKAVKAKAAAETPVETHARKASQIVDKVFTAVREKVEAKALVQSDIVALIEHLQSLADKALKDRAGVVRKLEAAALASKSAA